MIFRCKKRVFASWQYLLAGLLSACGGGGAIVAIVSVVTPLAGQWNVSGTDLERLNFDNVPAETVFFGLQLGEVNITATVTTATNVCDGGFVPGGNNIQLVGTLDDGVLALRRRDPPNNTSTCLQGTFPDLRTIAAGPPGQPTRPYQNDRVDVQMDLGLWVSDGNTPLKLKFNEPSGTLENNSSAFVEGCVVSVSPPDLFDSGSNNQEMKGFDTTTNAKPTIPEVSSNSSGPLFSQVVFEDGATLTLLNSSGETVTLHREPDTTTTCP